MLKTDAMFWIKTLERRMTDKVKQNKDIREDGGRLKGQEKKESRKYLHFIFNLFYHYTLLTSKL